MPKVTYTITARIEATVEMDEDLQEGGTEALRRAARLHLTESLRLLRYDGGRGGGYIDTIDIVRVQA